MSTKLSAAQEAALATIVRDGGRVRIFPPKCFNTGFASTGNMGTPFIQYRTANALLKAGRLKVVRHFAQDATEHKDRGSAMECIVIEAKP